MMPSKRKWCYTTLYTLAAAVTLGWATPASSQLQYRHGCKLNKVASNATSACLTKFRTKIFKKQKYYFILFELIISYSEERTENVAKTF